MARLTVANIHCDEILYSMLPVFVSKPHQAAPNYLSGLSGRSDVPR